MSDARTRELERRAAGGELEADAALLWERVRRGELDERRVRLAAYVGDPVARASLPDAKEGPGPIIYLIGGLVPWGFPVAVRGALAAVRPAVALWEERYPSWAKLHPRPRQVLEAVEAWLECPCSRHQLEVYSLRWERGFPEPRCGAADKLTEAFGWSRSSVGLEALWTAANAAGRWAGLFAVRDAIRREVTAWALQPGRTVPWQLGSVSAALVHDDIVRRPVDAVVNAANDRLLMQGGVAMALRLAAGVDVEREAVRSAPIELGGVIRTSAGALPAAWIYHAVVIRYTLTGGTRAADVRTAVRDLIECAAKDGVSTLALPLLGAGVGGLSAQQSLETILEALEEARPRHAMRVEVTVIDEDVHAAAEFAWNAFLPAEERRQAVNDAAQRYLREGPRLDRRRVRTA